MAETNHTDTELQIKIDHLEAEKAELLEACKLAANVLADHKQYDGNEPSRESGALEACCFAISKAEPSDKVEPDYENIRALKVERDRE